MKKLFYLFVLAFALMIVFLQIDDELSDVSRALLERIEHDVHSEAYLYLSGIFAHENESPEVLGEQLLTQYRKHQHNQLSEVNAYPDAKKLILPDADALCRAWEPTCLSYLFSDQVDGEALKLKHQVLVTRVNRFLTFTEYRTLLNPTLSEHIAPFQYITAVERIKVLAAISQYKKGEADSAIKMLTLQLSALRNAMALQDTVIGKLSLLMTLSEILDVLSVMLVNEKGDIKPIPRLNNAEKSFYMIAAREFLMSYNTYKALDKNPEFFEQGGNVPDWIVRMLFKPNMTINASAPSFHRLSELSLLSIQDFANEVNKSEIVKKNTLRNAVGDVLINIPAPSFEQYVGRFFDLDAKIALFNQYHSLKRAPNNIKNPYSDEQRAYLEGGSICVNGPFKDEKQLRCLRLTID